METIMSLIQNIAFGDLSIRAFDNAGTPWFVATDICRGLGIKNTSDALCVLRDVERQKLTIDGRETNIVRESGVYTLALRCQEALKEGTSAYNFRIWLTDEVLPAIRKTGQYRCATTPQIPSEYLTLEHQYRIQSEVAKRVHKDDVRYQTVYQALKAHFRVPKYTYILEKDFEAAVKFIQTCQLQQAEEAPKKLLPSEETHIWVSRDILKRLSIFVYCLRYLCNKPLMQAMRVMEALNIPDASKLWDAVNDLNLIMMERELARFGYDPKELPAYKAWIAQQA
jgi:prophage antirepressor-like protein